MGRLQPVVGAQFARILGLGTYRPSRVVTNAEICEVLDSSDEWIRERSGIIERRFAGAEETVISMSVAAGLQAIQRAGLQPSDIDAVIVGTVSHLMQTPSAAAIIADELGATDAMATDISAACAGFCYGIGMANDLVRGGSATNVLVIGVEKLSDITDPTDRGTAFLFADGAGAAVVGPSDSQGIGPVVWGSDGAQAAAITQRDDWNAVLSGEESSHMITMAGQTVFRWAISQMVPVANKALAAAGVSVEDLDAFVPHQANMRIIDQLVLKLRIPDDVVVGRDIAESGNTSAASIPLAMDRLLSEGKASSGDLALIIGFGAGLVYAAQVIELP